VNAPIHLEPVIRAVDPARADAVTAFVEAAAHATPFHLPVWTLATARGTGQTAHLLAAERGGAVVGVLPLTEIHSPLFGRALVSTGFGVDGGIVASDGRVARALAEAAWELAGRLSCPTLELRGGVKPGAGFACDDATYLGFARDLAADDEAELLAIPRKQRAEVRRSLSFDLEVTIDADPRDHHAVYAESVRNLGTPVFPARLFREVLAAFGERADVLTVRHKGRAVASVLSLYWRGTVYPYWGGGTAEARALRANDRMYFALMAHARAKGCTRFDFGRSKAGTGAAAFKKNWGFEPEPRRYFRRTADGQPVREVNPLSPKYRMQVAAWQRLPLGLANRLGPWIARGLG
jgi:FemAB-related protein (PEP-CTERM system-associated)